MGVRVHVRSITKRVGHLRSTPTHDDMKTTKTLGKFNSRFPRLLTAAATVYLGFAISMASFGQFVAPGTPTKRQVPDPYANLLQVQMKTQPAPAGVTAGCWRIAGVVKSVGPKGLLLGNATMVEWGSTTESRGGSVVTKLGPRRSTRPAGNLLFVSGSKAPLGQQLIADVRMSGSEKMIVDGTQRNVPRMTLVKAGGPPVRSKTANSAP